MSNGPILAVNLETQMSDNWHKEGNHHGGPKHTLTHLLSPQNKYMNSLKNI